MLKIRKNGGKFFVFTQCRLWEMIITHCLITKNLIYELPIIAKNDFM